MFDTLKKHFNQWGGGISLFFCFTHFSQDLMTGLLITLLPFIRQDMMLNYFQAGLLVSAYSVTSGLSQILGGWVGDRIKHRWISITMGLIGVGMSGFAAGLMPTYESLLVAMVAMGIFAGAYHPAAVPAISSLFEDRRGKAIGLHMIGGALGFGVGPFIGTAIAATINWHMAFLLLSIPAMVAGLSVTIWLRKIEPDIPRAEITAGKGKQSGADSPSLWQVLKKVSTVIILVVVVTFTSGSLLPFIPLYLVDHYSLTATMAAVWTSILRASGVLGSLLGGWLSDRWGNRQTVLLTLIAIGPAILLFTTVNYFPALAVLMIVIGIVWTMRETAVQTYLMERTPLRMHGIVFGIYFGIGQQGQSLLQPVYGVFMDMAGISSVFLIVGLISMATSITTIFIARKI
ncbi:MAG: MFS transporter [Dehalococcoidia bacterium]|nr:MFS transporter [Dehalococcoidia bacterium]